MKSIFSRIFASLSKESTKDSLGTQRGKPVNYEGLIIHAAPEREGDRWRLAGVIIKKVGDRNLERIFVRADTFSSVQDAEVFAIRKGKQIIDEQGSRLFSDDEASGRA